MTEKGNINVWLISDIVVGVIIGVPLTIFFGPLALTVMVITMIIMHLRGNNVASTRQGEKHIVLKSTEQTDELITVILPTINDKK